jgi:hypothetical protein
MPSESPNSSLKGRYSDHSGAAHAARCQFLVRGGSRAGWLEDCRAESSIGASSWSVRQRTQEGIHLRLNSVNAAVSQPIRRRGAVNQPIDPPLH